MIPSCQLKLFLFLFITISGYTEVQGSKELRLQGALTPGANGDLSTYWLGVAETNIQERDVVVTYIQLTVNWDKLSQMTEIVMQIGKVHYIPRFPEGYRNIDKFKVKNVTLKEVHQVDISQFRNLKILELPYNELEVIEANLFDLNLGITRIDLRENKIWFVGQNAFEKLTALNYLWFDANICFGKSYNNRNEINDDLNKNCYTQMIWLKSKYDQMIRELNQAAYDLNRKDTEYERFIKEKDEEISLLKNNIRDSENLMMAKQQEINLLNENITSMTSEFEVKISNLNLEVKEIKADFEALRCPSDDNAPDSPNSNLMLHIQTGVIVVFIVLFIIAFVFLYVNRCKIMIMNKAFTVPSDDEVPPRDESSATINYGLSIGDLSEKPQKQIKVEKTQKPSKTQLSNKKRPEVAVKPQSPHQSTKNPQHSGSVKDLVVIGNDSNIQAPAIPPRHSVVYSSIKKKLEEEPNSPYGRVWKTNPTDDEYVELKKKGQKY